MRCLSEQKNDDKCFSDDVVFIIVLNSPVVVVGDVVVVPVNGNTVAYAPQQ